MKFKTKIFMGAEKPKLSKIVAFKYFPLPIFEQRRNAVFSLL